MCEDRDLPYIYVPSKEELGQAGLTKRPTSCMLILPKALKGEAAKDEEAKEFAELYAEVRRSRGAAAFYFYQLIYWWGWEGGEGVRPGVRCASPSLTSLCPACLLCYQVEKKVKAAQIIF